MEPVITQRPKTTPKDFFLHLGVIAALYISTWSFIALWFALLDEIFKDPLAYFDPYSTGISLAIASLIVIFPTFLVLSWIIHNSEERDPEKRELRVRKWLVYFTTFLAGVIIVIDLITLLYRFLSGQELTAAFVWKVVVVLVVIGGIFAYYIYKIREQFSRKTAALLTAIVGLAVLASIIMGFSIMGSPQSQREKHLDQQRVNDLQSIQYQVVYYWQSKEELPATLDDLRDPISGFTVPMDPATRAPYEYVPTGELSFQLCATFTRETPTGIGLQEAYPYKVGLDENWQHGAGRTCFDRTIDPELYPPRSVTEKGLVPVMVR